MIFFEFSSLLTPFSISLSTFGFLSIDPAEIIHIRPVEGGKSEYYVHYHGCKFVIYFLLSLQFEMIICHLQERKAFFSMPPE